MRDVHINIQVAYAVIVRDVDLTADRGIVVDRLRHIGRRIHDAAHVHADVARRIPQRPGQIGECDGTIVNPRGQRIRRRTDSHRHRVRISRSRQVQRHRSGAAIKRNPRITRRNLHRHRRRTIARHRIHLRTVERPAQRTTRLQTIRRCNREQRLADFDRVPTHRGQAVRQILEHHIFNVHTRRQRIDRRTQRNRHIHAAARRGQRTRHGRRSTVQQHAE